MRPYPATREDTLEPWIGENELRFSRAPGRDMLRSLADIRHGLGGGQASAARLEGAMAAVEELIMPVLREIAPAGRLLAGGPSLARVLGLVLDGKPTASIKHAERLFNGLAGHAAGSPVAWWYPEDPGSPALSVPHRAAGRVAWGRSRCGWIRGCWPVNSLHNFT